MARRTVAGSVPSATITSIVSSAPSVPSTCLAVSMIEHRDRRPAEPVGVTQGDESGQRVGIGAGVRRDLHLVADLEVCLVGTDLVDGDLVAVLRRPALTECHRRHLLVARCPRDAERRAAPCGECLLLGLAVAVRVVVDHLGVAVDAGLGELHAVDPAHDVEVLRRHRVALSVVERVAEGELGAHLEVDVLGEVAEQVVERRLEAVGEHERADDERHADGDGEGDGDRATETRADAASGDETRGSAAHVAQSPKLFSLSSTASAVGSCISSTM